MFSNTPSNPNAPKDQESRNNVNETDASLVEGKSSNEEILARIISRFNPPPPMKDQLIGIDPQIGPMVGDTSAIQYPRNPPPAYSHETLVKMNSYLKSYSSDESFDSSVDSIADQMAESESIDGDIAMYSSDTRSTASSKLNPMDGILKIERGGCLSCLTVYTGPKDLNVKCSGCGGVLIWREVMFNIPSL